MDQSAYLCTLTAAPTLPADAVCLLLEVVWHAAQPLGIYLCIMFLSPLKQMCLRRDKNILQALEGGVVGAWVLPQTTQVWEDLQQL